jgi:hypothetical protein
VNSVKVSVMSQRSQENEHYVRIDGDKKQGILHAMGSAKRINLRKSEDLRAKSSAAPPPDKSPVGSAPESAQTVDFLKAERLFLRKSGNYAVAKRASTAGDSKEASVHEPEGSNAIEIKFSTSHSPKHTSEVTKSVSSLAGVAGGPQGKSTGGERKNIRNTMEQLHAIKTSSYDPLAKVVRSQTGPEQQNSRSSGGSMRMKSNHEVRRPTKNLPIPFTQTQKLGHVLLPQPSQMVLHDTQLNRASKEVQRFFRSKSKDTIDEKLSSPEVTSSKSNNRFQKLQDDDFVQTLNSYLQEDPSQLFEVTVVDKKGQINRFTDPEEIVQFLQKLGLDQSEKMSKRNPLDLAMETEDIDDEDLDVTWIDILGVSFQAIEEICSRLSIHPLTVEDCSHISGRQKLEPFNEYIFLMLGSLHHLHYSSNTVNLIKILILPSVIITIHAYPAFALEVARARLVRVSLFSLKLWI